MKSMFILCAALLVGCGGVPRTLTPAAKKVSTPELVRDLKQEHQDIQTHLTALKTQIDKLPDSEPQKAVVLQAFTPLPIDWSKMNVTLGNTETSVAADTKHAQDVEAENDKLKANDPARASFRFWGVTLTIIGVVGLALSFFAASVPLIGPFLTKLGSLLRWGSVVLIGIGLGLVTLAAFLSTIEYIILGTFLVVLAGGLTLAIIYIIKHHTQLASMLSPPIPKTVGA